jgi:CHAT domain-containing protein/Tfp pilus assembly protein PilF
MGSYASRAVSALGIVLGLLPTACGKPAPSPSVRVLPAVAGAAAESSMARGETHVYLLDLAAGTFADLAVDQRGVDVAVTVDGPDGRRLATSDSHFGARGAEPVPVIAERSGRYRLEVRPSGLLERSGKYEVRLAALRPATSRDRGLVAAERLFARAEALPADRPDEAIALYRQALALNRALGREREVGWILVDLGRTCFYRGDSRQALASYLQALALNQRLGERWEQAATLQNLGKVYSSQGETEQARRHYSRALVLWRELGDRINEARTRASLGYLYQSVGDLQQALDQLEPALAVFESEGLQGDLAGALTTLGDTYSRKGEGRQGIDALERALAIQRRIHDTGGEARTLNDLGWAYILLHDWRHVRECFAQARTLYRQAGDQPAEAVALANVAWADAEAGRSQAAVATFSQALPLLAAFGDRNAEAGALLGLAKARRRSGDLTGARTAVAAGIERVESLRGTSVSQEIRAAFLASKQELYAFEIDLLMEMDRRQPGAGWAAQALAAAERARARVLLDLLAESGADLRRGVDPTLLARVDAAQRRVNAAERRPTDERELRQVLAEADEAQAALRLASPAYAALTQPRPLSVPEIQRQVLDGDTLLLEYQLGRERSFLWAVTPEGLAAFDLPPRAEIEEAARRGYERLVHSREILAQEPAAESRAELSQLLLQPVAGLLGRKRLLIVPDGALHYLPFAALPRPGTSEPLVAGHEIVTSPSASALAVARRELAGRQPAPGTLAVVADPVFDAGDPRVRRGSVVTVAARRGPLPEGGDRFQRLGYSQDEAAALLSLVPPDRRLSALGFTASRETVLSGELGRYRIVHFSTHGVLDAEHPELSRLALSQVDEQGRPRPDGFVRAHEIYGLRWAADLVVLSACQTALGQEIRGEGLVGLTRGFQYAGARAVLVSLWEVDDEATAELMRRFYGEMLEHGQSPAAALRTAQETLRRQPEWQAPYYWAGFILQGDWRQPSPNPSASPGSVHGRPEPRGFTRRMR